jgi:hypothetical protein
MDTLAVFAEKRRTDPCPELGMDINRFMFIRPEDDAENPLYDSLRARIDMALRAVAQGVLCEIGKVDPQSAWIVKQGSNKTSKSLECTFKVELVSRNDKTKITGHVEFCISFLEEEGAVGKIRTNSVKHRVLGVFNAPKVSYY